MKKNILFFVMQFIFVNYATGQNAFICIPDSATGFSYNESTKKWERAKFNVNSAKKILKKNGAVWEWRVFGEKYGWSNCGGGDSKNEIEFNSSGFMFCDVLGGHIRMSKNTLRYVETYEIGFIDGKDNNDNTPFIEIGTCTPL